MRRTFALWLVLFGVYAATLGLDAVGDSDYGAREREYLMAVESLVDDRDVDVDAEYAERGIGFPLLLVPAWLVGGEVAIELFLAAIAALAVALGYRLARYVVPDPWALGAAGAVGLSPPFLAYGSAVYPELSAGAALAGAALLTIRLDARPGWRAAFACFALLGTLPWLGVQFIPAGLVIGFFAARAVWRARKRTLAFGAVELSLFSLAVYVGLNEALYDGPTPYGALEESETATGASSPGAYLERTYRLVALFIDREYGLLRWAPVFALAFAGLWWLWRSHRDRLARAVPQLREIELTADLCAAAVAAQLLVAAFLAPTMFGFWFPARHVLAALPLAIPLVAWGLRHAPRVGSVLAALTLAAIGVALRGRAFRWRLVRDRAPRRALGSARAAVPFVRGRRRVAVLAGRRDRFGLGCAGGARAAPLAADGRYGSLSWPTRTHTGACWGRCPRSRRARATGARRGACAASSSPACATTGRRRW